MRSAAQLVGPGHLARPRIIAAHSLSIDTTAGAVTSLNTVKRI